MVGKIILNYKIERLIGSGGMSAVYLASHTQINRKAAIKVLNKNLLLDDKIRQRFKNEAATLSQFQHTNIVILYDYIENKNSTLFIMEYVEGKTIDEYILTESGPIPEKKLVSLFTQILNGVYYAHSRNVIHRDIKPSNIIITKNENIKILDFGIAKVLNQESLNLTKAGSRIGTALYMSPEQVKGEIVDKRSDIYSLGVTLFQMATGICPYNKTSTEYEVYNKIVNEPLPNAQNIYVGISHELNKIIIKATEKSVSLRYQSCQAFLEDLQKINKKKKYVKSRKINKTKNKLSFSFDTRLKYTYNKKLLQNRLFSSMLDWVFPVLYFMFFFFTFNISYQAYSLFQEFKWINEDANTPLLILWMDINKRFLVSFIGDLGPLKMILSYLLFIYFAFQCVSLTINGKTISKKIFKLKIISTQNLNISNFIKFIILRKAINIFLLLTYFLSILLENYSISFFIIIILLFYYFIDKLLIFKDGLCLHDYISKTKVVIDA
ncbi:MAG: protein kinase [Bacteroidales bacterium]|nr:protein kinase [Bacteroidales bacterium]